MAKHEAYKKPPAFIDYSSDSDTEVTKRYNAAHFYDHWKKELVRQHRVAAHPITIKELTLWKRMIHEFSPEILVKMVDRWIKINNAEYAANFMKFYFVRYKYYEEVVDKDYTWE